MMESGLMEDYHYRTLHLRPSPTPEVRPLVTPAIDLPQVSNELAGQGLVAAQILQRRKDKFAEDQRKLKAENDRKRRELQLQTQKLFDEQERQLQRDADASFAALEKESLGMWSSDATASGQASAPPQGQGPAPAPVQAPVPAGLERSEVSFPPLGPGHSQEPPLDLNRITGETVAMDTTQPENNDGQD